MRSDIKLLASCGFAAACIGSPIVTLQSVHYVGICLEALDAVQCSEWVVCAFICTKLAESIST